MLESAHSRQMVPFVYANFKRYFIATILFSGATIVYYFGELVNFLHLDELHWSIFYTIHDFQRLLFLIPITYISLHFRVKGVIAAILLTSIALLPRAVFISPFFDSTLRTTIFMIVATGFGLFCAMLSKEREKSKKLEANIAETDQFKTMLEKLYEGIFIVGPDYKIRFCNSRMRKNFGDGVGSYCYDYLPEQTKPCEFQPCHFLRLMKDDTYKWEYMFKDGRVFETVASPFIDSDGQLCQLTAIREITQRKRKEKELLGVSKLKSEILSDLSHELRNPLTSIKGIVTSLMRQDVKFDPETQEAFFLDMLEETERLDTMVADLLEMSKFEAGISKAKRQNFDVADIIQKVLAKEERLHPEHVIVSQIEPGLPQLNAAYSQIEQVLTNLIDNAANYSEKGTKIIIAAAKCEQMLEIDVSDQGIGISPSNVRKIFQRFYRVNGKLKGRNKSKDGLGLGLSICRKIIEGHKGNIWVESTLGKGSVFHFTLPFVPESER